MRTNRYSGFTLLEILVVMILVGIMLTVAILNLDTRKNDEQLYEEARRLTRKIELANQEALIKSLDLGLLIQSDYYAFYQYEERKWAVLQHDILDHHQLPNNIEMLLNLEGLSENLPDDSEGTTPQIAILSSGENTPFEITFRNHSGHDDSVSVTGTITGDLQIERSQKNE